MKNMITFLRKHDELTSILCCALVIAIIAASIYGYINHTETKLRNQAIARAKQMDGRIYTIDNVAWNFVGDTKLILKNEHGMDAGWVMIYMNNPLNDKINPLFLVFTDPHGKIPVPMKVKAHFRPTPWTQKDVTSTRENYTGSFLEFEIL